jgi:hypothetical protein
VVFRSYAGAVESLSRVVAGASEDQIQLAIETGCALRLPLPRIVAAAYLRDHLDARIAGDGPSSPRAATPRQLVFLKSLIASGPPRRDARTIGIVSAWITYYLALRSIDCLSALRIGSGDVVMRRHDWTDSIDGTVRTYEDKMIVSSIGADGLVYFKGGNGQCAHPHRLRRP